MKRLHPSIREQIEAFAEWQMKDREINRVTGVLVRFMENNPNSLLPLNVYKSLLKADSN